VTPPDICVEDLHKRFGSGQRAVYALRGINLSVARGEVFGLLGQNGAGKTTLIKILLDIVRPSAGSASLLGASSRSTAARERAGYLPEDHRFPEYLTARQVLELYGGLSRLPRREVRRRGAELLDLVGLPDTGKRKVRAFSKGMKQRLGIAQALIAQPQVLFLDEPTDGVDPLGRREIRALIQRLRDDGKTIFLNSHLLSEVEQICDRVAFVHEGSLVREGTVAELTGGSDRYIIGASTAVTEQHLAGSGFTIDGPDPGTGHDPQRVAVRLTGGGDAAVALDRLVDSLRGKGIGLRHLERQRLSLEDVFVNIHDASQARPEAPR